MALLAVTAVARSGLSLLFQLLILAGLVLALWFSLRRHGWFGGRLSCRRLRWDQNGRWLWIGAEGRSLVLRLRRAVVWRHLVVLHFVGPGGRRSLCLLPDSLEADSLRRLRLCLRNLPVYEAAAEASPP